MTEFNSNNNEKKDNNKVNEQHEQQINELQHEDNVEENKQDDKVEEFQQNEQDESNDTLNDSTNQSPEQKCENDDKKSYGYKRLIAVAVGSSILGGIIVGALFQFVVPFIQPGVGRFFNGNNSGIYKKIEIEKTNEPLIAIAEKAGPSVVGIKTTVRVNDFFFRDTVATPQGSGVIFRSDGYILTNNHVISDAMNQKTNEVSKGAKIEIYLPNKKDKPYSAQVIGRDEKTDLAVLKINDTNLPAIEMGNSDELKVGQLAVAIGNPSGMELMGSVTSGIISGLNRTITVEDGKELKLIQTDASINPGNSGGALVNSRGQLIGVNTAKVAGQGFEGLGFAIPVNKVKEITSNLIEFKYVKGRPLLGISGDSRFNEDIAKKHNVPSGVLVADVTPLSGAYKAGMQAGDIIVRFDGKKVKSIAEINDIKSSHKPGDVVPVEVYRDGNTMTLNVKLSEEGAAG